MKLYDLHPLQLPTTGVGIFTAPVGARVIDVIKPKTMVYVADGVSIILIIEYPALQYDPTETPPETTLVTKIMVRSVGRGESIDDNMRFVKLIQIHERFTTAIYVDEQDPPLIKT